MLRNAGGELFAREHSEIFARENSCVLTRFSLYSMKTPRWTEKRERRKNREILIFLGIDRNFWAIRISAEMNRNYLRDRDVYHGRIREWISIRHECEINHEYEKMCLTNERNFILVALRVERRKEEDKKRHLFSRIYGKIYYINERKKHNINDVKNKIK